MLTPMSRLTDAEAPITLKAPVAKRILRVTKWLSTTPAVATCNGCGREFKVPMASLSRTKDAQESLQKQFDEHQCSRQEANSQ
jgi:4-hydroxy-3-methylbut-2-en-1-yl diphosphate synthase IspG/GcpE